MRTPCLPERLGVSRHIVDGSLGMNFAAGAHGTIDAVQAGFGGDERRLFKVQLQLLIDLAEHHDGRQRQLGGRKSGRDAAEP